MNLNASRLTLQSLEAINKGKDEAVIQRIENKIDLMENKASLIFDSVMA